MPLTAEELTRLREAANARTEAVAELAMRICAIPSPTGAEGERAAFAAQLLRERGYEPEIDAVGNVYARRGSRGGPVVLLLAHIDTVFPAGTPMTPRREGDRIYGPSIGDNSMNVAGTLTALDVLDALGIETAADLVFVANVGEEGLGNVRGAWAAVERYRPDLGAVLVIDGRQGRVIHVAVGSKRWRVTVSGPGGHSYGAFGLPSAIHGLGRIIAAIADIEVPREPKTTYNVGVIEGGTSVNTIAARASALIDMRSTDLGALDRLAARVREIVAHRAGPGLETHIEVLGERPAGARPASDPLVRRAVETLRWLGYEPELQASSTDANVPISLNIPAVCVGIAHGDKAHTLDEYVEVPGIGDGLAQVLRLMIETADDVGMLTR